MALSYGVMDYIEVASSLASFFWTSLGFYQEFQAEKKTDSLRALSSPTATVLRSGNIEATLSAEVVPGDIVIAKTGDTVPADLRIFDSMHLECDEKVLTEEGKTLKIFRY